MPVLPKTQTTSPITARFQRFSSVVCTLGTTLTSNCNLTVAKRGFAITGTDAPSEASQRGRLPRTGRQHGHTAFPAPEEETLGNLFHRGHAHEEAASRPCRSGSAEPRCAALPLRRAGHGADPQGRVLDAVPDLEREHRFVVGGLSGGRRRPCGSPAHAGRLGGRAPAP